MSDFPLNTIEGSCQWVVSQSAVTAFVAQSLQTVLSHLASIGFPYAGPAPYVVTHALSNGSFTKAGGRVFDPASGISMNVEFTALVSAGRGCIGQTEVYLRVEELAKDGRRRGDLLLVRPVQLPKLESADGSDTYDRVADDAFRLELLAHVMQAIKLSREEGLDRFFDVMSSQLETRLCP